MNRWSVWSDLLGSTIPKVLITFSTESACYSLSRTDQKRVRGRSQMSHGDKWRRIVAVLNSGATFVIGESV